MSERIPLGSMTEEELAALYDSAESVNAELQKLRRLYEWSAKQWSVERRRLTADIEWMRASAAPAQLVSQLYEATTTMNHAEAGSPELDTWERRWADHFAAMGFRLMKAEEALGRSIDELKDSP
ncbi:hypothetical protein AB0K53_00900 [Streptomyces tuirus]|uniref:hypothetical protein n=1 Tax=Streptomyces tuirus TaxID=68278 RepID=UPI003413AA8D